MLELDPYVVDTLMGDLAGHDRHPSAFLVYLALWARTDGGRQPSAPISLAALQSVTGLSKRGVQLAVVHLERRALLRLHRAAATAVPRYEVLRPWRARRRS